MEKIAAVVLSAGSGTRMRSTVPKQYLDLCGNPVIYYSLKALQESSVDEIVLVTGAEDAAYCKTKLVDGYGLDKVKKVIPGGKERYDSVYEGLKAIGNADYVLIHDGARPMLTPEMIERIVEQTRKEQACVLAVPVKDTIKVADERHYADRTPDRSTLWMIQTPQAFSYPLIRDSYEKLYQDMEQKKQIPAITDDAMVLEYAYGKKVKLVEGSYRNIKITTPEDLEIAAVFLTHYCAHG